MKRRLEWQWNVKVLLFTAIFFPLTISLGFWQLDRASQKRDMLTVQQARKASPYIPFSSQAGVDQQYLKVIVEGDGIAGVPTLLLDNRVRHGRPGYEVLNVVQTTSGETLLVNRGWLEGSPDRRQLPRVAALGGDLKLKGYLYHSPGQQLMLGEDNWSSTGELEVIQNADPDKVAERLGIDLYPYTLRLANNTAGALEADWVVVNIRPEKHTGYAVQWFVMAVVLLIMTVFANSNLATISKKSEAGR